MGFDVSDVCLVTVVLLLFEFSVWVHCLEVPVCGVTVCSCVWGGGGRGAYSVTNVCYVCLALVVCFGVVLYVLCVFGVSDCDTCLAVFERLCVCEVRCVICMWLCCSVCVVLCVLHVLSQM